MCVISAGVHERIPAMWVFLGRWVHLGSLEGGRCPCTPRPKVEHVSAKDMPALVEFMRVHEGELSDELEERDPYATPREKWRRTIELFERCPSGFEYV
jgi:hypothetical protein